MKRVLFLVSLSLFLYTCPSWYLVDNAGVKLRKRSLSLRMHAAGGESGQNPKVPRVGAPMPEGKRPDWFHVPAPGGSHTKFEELRQSIQGLGLHTVCEEAKCPNIGECWNGGTATIMLLGDTCTRGCRFCAVKTSAKPLPADPLEPFKTAEALMKWNVSYIVLTSVDRDDMEDGGAAHFATTVKLIKKVRPSLLVECLVSDFAGDLKSVETLAHSGLDVYAHNVETVQRLQKFVRDRRATYDQSLTVLKHAKRSNPKLFTKTSLMLGLGETKEEVLQAMADMRSHEVDVLTLGQYLRPTNHHLAVVEYVTPESFEWFRQEGEKMGFKYVAAGPLIRSSYKAGEYFLEKMIKHTSPTPTASYSDVSL
jgi:lipoic acid synthetase